MSAEKRLTILKELMKKTVPADPEYGKLNRECEVLFGCGEGAGQALPERNAHPHTMKGRKR